MSIMKDGRAVRFVARVTAVAWGAIWIGGYVPAVWAMPFPWIATPVQLDATVVGNSAYGVIPSLVDDDRVYYTDSGAEFAVNQVAILRDGSGQIIGGSNQGRFELPTNGGSGNWLKSLDVFSETATTAQLLIAVEEGGADTDGSIDIVTITNPGPSFAMTSAAALDLTGLRADGGAAYDPEGIAVDRANSFVYVQTDDATDTSVEGFSVTPGVTPTISSTASPSVTVGSGISNATDLIVLPNGDVLAASGSGATNQIVKVSDPQGAATVTQILSVSTLSASGLQDLMVYDGFLYVLAEDGEIGAWEFNTVTNDVVDSLMDDFWDLDAIFGTDEGFRGLNVTPGGELLVTIDSAIAGGIDPGVYAFNLPLSFVPEPSVLVLLSLGLAVLAGSRRRR